MKKIPSLDDLRRADLLDSAGGESHGGPDARPGPDARSDPDDGPRPTDQHGQAEEAGASTSSTPVIRADELPADVLEHAVRLGDGEAASEAPPPKRGAQRKGGGNRMQVRRRYARERAVQALYAWDIGDASATEVLRYFVEQQDMSRADIEFFEAGFKGVAHAPGPIDALIAPVIDRGFDDLDPVERAILRLGVWELRSRPDIPVRVVINEMVDVAKRFGAEQGHRFVNGVLDTIARDLRAAEIG